MTVHPWLLCIDLDDTLIVQGQWFVESSLRCATIIAAAFGRRTPYPLELFTRQHEIDQALIAERGMNVENFVEAWVHVYRAHCADQGVSAEAYVEERLRYAANGTVRGPFAPIAGVVDALTALNAAGHELHLVTKGVEEFQLRKAHESGVAPYFRSLNVCLHDKREALERLCRGRRERVMMIGDSLRSDIHPAVTMGILATLVPGDAWSYHRSVHVPDDAYLRIPTFDRLPALLADLEREGRVAASQSQT